MDTENDSGDKNGLFGEQITCVQMTPSISDGKDSLLRTGRTRKNEKVWRENSDVNP